MLSMPRSFLTFQKFRVTKATTSPPLTTSALGNHPLHKSNFNPISPFLPTQNPATAFLPRIALPSLHS